MFILLLLFCIPHIGTGEEENDCEPGFADTCFTSVTNDLQYMLGLQLESRTNITNKSVRDLCMALDDSLSCTSDIVDTDCSVEDGKDTFDSWIKALRGAFSYVCGGDGRPIKELLLGASCWNIEDFVLCTEEQGDIGHVRNLLHTKLDNEECENLRRVTSKCFVLSKVGSCRELDTVFHMARGMIHSFFQASHCEVTTATLETDGSSSVRQSLFSTILVMLMTLLFIFMLK